MPTIPVYQVDAFTSAAFKGNPAAVCPLDAWLPDDLMQAVAAENNLSETAFFAPEGDGFRIRWFTPAVEVQLCGHATLASALVLFDRLQPGRTEVRFESRSGPLGVRRAGGKLTLDFPVRPMTPGSAEAEIADALGVTPVHVYRAVNLIAVLEEAATVRALSPDLGKIAALDTPGLQVTAPGGGVDADVDFVSRYFAPARGIPEDPVTGSAHCGLMPYWTARLGRTELRARQVSARGGELWCRLEGDRVFLSGEAVLVMTGTLHL